MAHLLVAAAAAFALVALLSYCVAALWDIAKARRWAHIPGPSVIAPSGFVGLGREPHLKAAEYSRRYGPVSRLRVGREHVVVVTDPAILATLLSGPEGAQAKFSELYSRWSFLGSQKPPFLYTDNKADWRCMRTKLQHPFSISNMRKAFPGIAACAKDLVEFVEGAGEGQTLEMNAMFQQFSLSVMLKVFFDTGIDVNKYKQELSSHLSTVLGETRWPSRSLQDSDAGESSAWLNDFFRFLARVVQSKAVAPGEETRQLWAALASAKSLDAQDMQAQIGFMFMAGFDTTAAAIGWSLYCLATHPNWQEKVAQELQAARIAEKWDSGSLEYSDVMGLRVLYKVVLEAMRLYPANPTGTMRKLETQMQIGKYLLPKGTAVWVPTYAVHRSAINWDEPDAFDPTRWQQENASAGRKGGKRYIPFSTGSKGCLGQALAMVEIKTALAVLLARHAFGLAPGMSDNGDEVATFKGTLQFRGGLRVVASRRAGQAC